MPDSIFRSINQSFAAGKWLPVEISLVTGAVPNHWMSNWLNSHINRNSNQSWFISRCERGHMSPVLLHVFIDTFKIELNLSTIDNVRFIMFLFWARCVSQTGSWLLKWTWSCLVEGDPPLLMNRLFELVGQRLLYKVNNLPNKTLKTIS